MERVLVTGGTGVFGRHLLPRLKAAGCPVRVMSRQSRPAAAPPELEWVNADMRDQEALAAAVEGVHTLVHAASSPARDTHAVDVAGTAQLLETARAAGCRHFVYVSIVGIERVPHPYYQAKLEAEALVQNSGLTWSILRATQFHNLMHWRLKRWMDWPVAWLATEWQYQPVHPGEVAHYLVEHLTAGTTGRWRDFAGPEVLTIGQMVEQWAAVRGRGPRVWRRPTGGAYAQALRAGALTAPARATGKITWSQWLRL